MAYIFNGKFHRSDKLTCDDHRDIALLVNAGVRHTVLAKDYGVSPETIHMIAYKRKRWIPENRIAKDENAKLRFAQRLYRNPATTPMLRAYIEEETFRPLVSRIVPKALESDLDQRLLGDILERTSARSAIYVRRVPCIAFETLKEHALRGHKWYTGIDDAIMRATARIRAQEPQYRTAEQRREHAFAGKRLHRMVATLPSDEREIVTRYYGIGCPVESSEAIAKDFSRTRQWVWNHLQDALNLLRPRVYRALSRM
jgi:hypothetical protein